MRFTPSIDATALKWANDVIDKLSASDISGAGQANTARPSGTETDATFAAVTEGEEIVSVCAHRDIALTTSTGLTQAIGVSHWARREHNDDADRQLLTELRSLGGGSLRPVLLFAQQSDVDSFVSLGFSALPHLLWTAAPNELPNMPGRLEPTDDIERLVDIHRASFPDRWQGVHKNAAMHRAAVTRNGCGDAFLVGDEDYVIARPLAGGTLWVDEIATCTVSPLQLWGSLFLLAISTGSRRVQGFLRPDHAGAPFVARRPERGVPMLLMHSQQASGSHFSSVDRF